MFIILPSVTRAAVRGWFLSVRLLQCLGVSTDTDTGIQVTACEASQHSRPYCGPRVLRIFSFDLGSWGIVTIVWVTNIYTHLQYVSLFHCVVFRDLLWYQNMYFILAWSWCDPRWSFCFSPPINIGGCPRVTPVCGLRLYTPPPHNTRLDISTDI